MPALTLGLIAADAARLEEIHAIAARLDLEIVFEAGEAGTQIQPDIVVLNAALPDVFDQIGRIAAASRATDIIVAAEDDSPQAILQAIRAGAREVAGPPWSDSLPKALEAVIRSRQIIVDPDPRRSSRLVGFLSAKGGCGATSAAVHVASACARHDQSGTLLIDLDVEAGLIGFLLRIPDAAREPMVPVQTRFGPDVVPAPPAGLDPPLDPDAVISALRAVRRQYDWGFVDLGRGLSPLTARVLPEMDSVFLVSTCDAAALYKARDIARWWTARNLGDTRLLLVLNRMTARSILSPPEAAQLLGIPLTAALPEAGPELTRAYDSGTLLAPTSELGRKLEALARAITSDSGFVREY